MLQRKPALAGLVATGPFIRLRVPAPALKVGFGRLMNHIWPSLTLPNDLDPNGVSNDPAVVAAYMNDPLVHDRISVRVGVELLEAANWLDGFTGQMHCPTLLMHGGNDPFTSPAGSSDFAKRNKGNMTWKEWEGLKHEIHNEPQQGEVLAFLAEWMERNIKG